MAPVMIPMMVKLRKFVIPPPASRSPGLEPRPVAAPPRGRVGVPDELAALHVDEDVAGRRLLLGRHAVGSQGPGPVEGSEAGQGGQDTGPGRLGAGLLQ